MGPPWDPRGYRPSARGFTHACRHLTYLFDASDSTLRIYESLFDASGDLKESVVQRIGEDADLTRFMILDRIEILPDYRGRALGAKVVLHLMERFAGDRGVVVVEPFPIQAESAPEAAPFGSAWREMMGLDSLQPDEKKASASLRKFYSKVGFVPLPGSRFMVRKIA